MLNNGRDRVQLERKKYGKRIGRGSNRKMIKTQMKIEKQDRE